MNHEYIKKAMEDARKRYANRRPLYSEEFYKRYGKESEEWEVGKQRSKYSILLDTMKKYGKDGDLTGEQWQSIADYAKKMAKKESS